VSDDSDPGEYAPDPNANGVSNDEWGDRYDMDDLYGNEEDEHLPPATTPSTSRLPDSQVNNRFHANGAQNTGMTRSVPSDSAVGSISKRK
jgi:hypothetical protein